MPALEFEDLSSQRQSEVAIIPVDDLDSARFT